MNKDFQSRMECSEFEALLAEALDQIDSLNIETSHIHASFISECSRFQIGYGIPQPFGLQLANVALDRKSLSETAIHDPAAFDKLVELARTHLPKPEAAAK